MNGYEPEEKYIQNITTIKRCRIKFFLLEMLCGRSCKRENIVNTDINIQRVRQNKPHKGPSITNSMDIFMDMNTISNIVRYDFLDNFIFHDTYRDALLKISLAPTLKDFQIP